MSRLMRAIVSAALVLGLTAAAPNPQWAKALRQDAKAFCFPPLADVASDELTSSSH